MRRMPILRRIAPLAAPGCPGVASRGIRRCFHRLSPCRGQVAYVLLTRAPVAGRHWRTSAPAAPRLACVKPVASVHPEPGSNSSLLYLVFSFFSESFRARLAAAREPTRQRRPFFPARLSPRKYCVLDIDRVTFISPTATRRGSMPLSLLYFSSLLQSFQCPCAPRGLSPGKALQSYNLFPNRQNFQRKILNFFFGAGRCPGCRHPRDGDAPASAGCPSLRKAGAKLRFPAHPSKLYPQNLSENYVF